MAIEAAPTWKGIVRAADENAASMIVLGPHRRSGLLGHLQGSVAAAVVTHTDIPVLLIPEQPCRAPSAQFGGPAESVTGTLRGLPARST
jgi:hypothetical protein